MREHVQNALAILHRIHKYVPKINLRLAGAAMVAVGILHICATLAAPHMIQSSAYTRLSPLLPLNKMLVLPKLTPESQPLPFLTADVRYAMCRYDTANGGVRITARLPRRGWSLALHTPEGDNIYSALGQEDRPTTINLHLIPAGTRFSGLTPEALGVASRDSQVQVIATRRGIAVIRAPDRGTAYEQTNEIELNSSSCQRDAQQ